MDLEWIQNLSQVELLSAAFLTVLALSLSTRFLSSLSFGTASSDRERKPPVLPYWIPWIGHAFELNFSAKAFLKTAR